MSAQRLFFAVWPPEDLRQRLWHSLAPLRERVHGVRWVPPERYHITLRFLGDVPARQVAGVSGAARSLESESAFGAVLTGVGTFPARGTPRVYWVGVEAEALGRIRTRLDAALARRGFPVDPRRFAPHMTIGRVPRRGGARGPRGNRGPAERWSADSGRFLVDAVDLVRSELFPDGPRYANVHKVVLSATGETQSGRQAG